MSQELRMWIFIVEDTLGGTGQKECCIERERYEEAYQSLGSEFDLEEQAMLRRGEK